MSSVQEFIICERCELQEGKDSGAKSQPCWLISACPLDDIARKNVCSH